jgi:hypothetical protein
MSDNVNKMGTDVDAVRTAFAGFAKQNYTLLDNLALGYGGTRTEMERLLKDAEAYMASQGKTVQYNINNLADVYTAIDVIQQKLGIAGTTIAEAEKTIAGASTMAKSAWSNLMIAMSSGNGIETASNNFAFAVEKLLGNLVPVIERSLMGIGQLIENTAPQLAQIMANAIIRLIPPFVKAVYTFIVTLLQGVWQGLKDAFKGKKLDLGANLNDASESATDTADGMKKLGEETEKAGKKAKKSLAAFDDLQILADNSADASAEAVVPTTIGGGGGGFGEGDEGQVKEKEGEINTTLATIMAVVGGLMIALGLLVLFFGNVPLGLGLIALGALSMGVAMADLSKTDVGQEVIGTLMAIMGVVGGALLAIGIMLLFLGVGTIPIAVGLIVAGAVMLIGGVGSMAALNPSDIQSWLALIMGIAGGALLALGVILCMVGSVPLGVGMIIAGAVLLVSSFTINSDEMTQQITGWVAVIMGIAGGALLVLGIILTCSGNLLLGIPLIAVGAVALVTPIALNWDVIVEKLQGPIGAITAIVGGALLVLGIILVCCGILPLGIALIVAGAASLVTVSALNWDVIVEYIKGLWGKVKEFWNEHIAPIFTAAWWKNLAIKAGNGLIAGFEGAINGIITMFENMVNWAIKGINKISFDVPEWLGGGHFGFDLKSIKLDRVSIPRLAQGAVIPPNREFLAVLGDQKRGTNIEAPLQTIVDAFNIALANNGGASNGNTTVVLEIDGREFGHAVIEQGQRESRRLGTRMVMA